ncbi:MAG: hypothetical protein WD801_00435 [Gemmatimonadaceae bacterium]
MSTNMPSAQMPAVTPSSTRLGVYSTISPSGDGMNPGTTSPRPFSTQMLKNSTAQAGISHCGLRRRGWIIRAVVASTFRPIADQIHGTSAVWPSRPKKRYFALMPWCVGE